MHDSSIPDGTYTWQQPSGGTAGNLTQHATVSGGRVTDWRTVSGDGTHIRTTDAQTLATYADGYLLRIESEMQLRSRLAPLGLSLPIQYAAVGA